MMARSDLRISDLKQRTPTTTRMMNVKIPAHVSDTIARLATELGASKTEIVTVLLNHGLERAAKVGIHTKPGK